MNVAGNKRPRCLAEQSFLTFRPGALYRTLARFYHGALMSKARLPHVIDPRRAADRRLSYEGSVPLSRLSRLVSYLLDDEGEVDAELLFAVDEERIRHVQGRVAARVRMRCERCLEPVELSLAGHLNLAFADSAEAARQLPGHYDPWVLDEDGKQNLHQAVEEELILSLPLIPQHEDCVIKTEYRDPDAPVASEEKKPNPFAVLAKLKEDKTDN